MGERRTHVDGAGPERRPTMVDVAVRAGVSAQTVSNVVNERGGFGPLTKDRVEEAIAALGFRPNRQAQGLRSLRTGLLGFDLTARQMAVDNPFTISFLQALVRAAEAHHQHVVVSTHDGPDGVADRDLRATVAARVVDGFVLSDTAAGDPRPRTLADLHVPVVAFGRLPRGVPGASIDIDNTAAMAQAVDHLVARGCRRFAYVGYPTAEFWDVERHRGARQRLRELGFDLPRARCVSGVPAEVGPSVRRLLTSREPPDAVITSSDSLAVVVVNTAHATGLVVGEQVAVTGFDAGPLRTLVHPHLTSVRIPVELVAERLVVRLIDQIRGEPAHRRELVPTELVLGGSA